LEQYKIFLEELAKNKKMEVVEIKKKMANCGSPGFTSGGGGVCIQISLFNSAKLYSVLLALLFF